MRKLVFEVFLILVRPAIVKLVIVLVIGSVMFNAKVFNVIAG